jgi:hypothetical protein
VVLKPVRMPESLSGPNLVNVLVPAGVPMPTGPRGQSSFFR